jgi:hypothetical protein
MRRHAEQGADKMDVRYFILARHAESTGDGAFNALGAGVDIQAATVFPVLYPVLYVVAKVAFERGDLSYLHVLRVQVIDPNGEQIVASDLANIPIGAEFPAGREFINASILVGLHNIMFKAEGLYEFQLVVDGEIAKVTKLRMERLPSTETPVLAPETGAE